MTNPDLLAKCREFLAEWERTSQTNPLPRPTSTMAETIASIHENVKCIEQFKKDAAAQRLALEAIERTLEKPSPPKPETWRDRPSFLGSAG